MSHFNKKFTSGFTLIELLVSIGIATLILTVVIQNQNKYTSAAGLSNAVQAMAADITLAQTYGVSVKQVSSNNFNTAYGIHFRTTAGGGNTGGTRDYVLFADYNPKDGRYAHTSNWTNSGPTCPNPPGECISRIRMNKDVEFIGPFCFIQTPGAYCPSSTQTIPGSNATAIHRIDITFARPQTKAIFKLYSSTGTLLNATAIGVGVRVRHIATREEKWVYVYETGQVYIQ